MGERILGLTVLIPFIVLLVMFTGGGLYLAANMVVERTWSPAFLAIAAIVIVGGGASIRVAARSALRLMSKNALTPMLDTGLATRL